MSITKETRDRRSALQTLRTRARRMRREPASTERLFWHAIRARKLGGYKFKRQYPIGNYIVDFVCLERRLVVELDGILHNDRIAYDEHRDAFLRSQGFEVWRFPNEKIQTDMAVILGTLKHKLDSRAAPSKEPSLPSGERAG